MKLIKASFVLGCAIMLLNIGGSFVSLRNPAIYTEPRVSFPNDITLTYDQFKQQVQRLPNESDRDYVYRLTSVVNNGIAHYWRAEGIDKYNIRVPIWENYLLYIDSYIQPDHYLYYDFQDIDRAMQRGVGWCSQESYIMVRLLQRQGIAASILGIDYGSHTVVQVQSGAGAWFIADPDYGVVMPYTLAEIQAEPAMVKPYYANITINDQAVDSLDADGPDGLVGSTEPVDEMMGRFYASPGAATAPLPEALLDQENMLYVLKWLIPSVLLVPYALILTIGWLTQKNPFIGGLLQSHKRQEKDAPERLVRT